MFDTSSYAHYIQPMSTREILARWPSINELAADIGAPHTRVRKWIERDSVPPEHWNALVRAGKKRRLGVSLQALADAAER